MQSRSLLVISLGRRPWRVVIARFSDEAADQLDIKQVRLAFSSSWSSRIWLESCSIMAI